GRIEAKGADRFAVVLEIPPAARGSAAGARQVQRSGRAVEGRNPIQSGTGAPDAAARSGPCECVAAIGPCTGGRPAGSRGSGGGGSGPADSHSVPARRRDGGRERYRWGRAGVSSGAGAGIG